MSTTYSINGRPVSERQYLQRVLPVVFAERDALLRQIETVRALHRPDDDGFCACTFSYPCRTVRALDGTP